MQPPKLLNFTEVRISIPQQMILELYNNSHFLTRKECVEMRGKLKEIERAINRLSHARSIVGDILLKTNAHPQQI